MKRTFLILGAATGLILSTNAAAFDETRDDVVAPGLHFSVSFGGSSPPRLSSPALRDPSIALHESGGADNTRLLIVVGVIAVAVIVVVASHHGDGRGNGY